LIFSTLSNPEGVDFFRNEENMKKILTLLAVTIMIILPSCQTPVQVEVTEAVESITTAIPTVIPETEAVDPVTTSLPTAVSETEAPVTSEQVTIAYAKNFTLEYKDGY